MYPLDAFFREIGFHPWHGYGIAGAVGKRFPIVSKNSCVMLEYPWQAADGVSRSDIRRTIQEAQDKLREVLRYDVEPTYRVDTVDFSKWYESGGVRWGYLDGAGRYTTVRLPVGKLRAIGTERLDVIKETAGIEPLDLDSDGFPERWSVSVTVPDGTTADEVAVYFESRDRFDGSPIGPRWRIEPVNVRLYTGGSDCGECTIAEISGPLYLLVRPFIYERVESELPPNNPSIYVKYVSVYRRYTDTNGSTTATAQAVLKWDRFPCWSGCYENDRVTSTDPAAVGTAVGRVQMTDPAVGIVAPLEAAYNSTAGTWSTDCWTSTRTPDRVEIRYLAGHPLKDGQMDPAMARLVLMLTVADLDAPPCGSEEALRRVKEYRQDLAVISGNGDEKFAIPDREVRSCPWGTRRGHVLAYRQAKRLRDLGGVSVG